MESPGFAAPSVKEQGNETLLEAEQVGGTNWNREPAPVRTLARAARLVNESSSWAGFGLDGHRPVPDLEAVLANSARVARYVTAAFEIQEPLDLGAAGARAKSRLHVWARA